MRWSTVALAGLVVISLSVPAFAATLKVPKAFETIQAAADAAEEGDTIIVSKGTYCENVVLGTSGVRLIGKSAILDGNIRGVDGTCLEIDADDILVQGFRFRHGRDQVHANGSNLTVTKCTFTNADDQAVEITGPHARVEKCLFLGMDNEAIDIDGDEAVVMKNRISNGGDGGIDVQGDDSVIEKNTVNVVEDDDCIYASGDGVRVEKNTCRNADGDGVEISGDDAVAVGNKVAYLDGSGIYVSGDGALVEGNTCLSTLDAGIYVSGDDFAILANKVAHCINDEYGIEVSGRGSDGPARIEGNKVVDVVDEAIYVSGKYIEILNNSVARCGGENHAAFYISASDCLLSGNKASDIDSDGYYINGDGNRLENCVAQKCTDDGFCIRPGADSTEIDRCTAAACDGEGIENFGTNTDVTNSKFRGNRIDVTNDGSFDDFSGNSFKTGGTETPAEVDTPEI